MIKQIKAEWFRMRTSGYNFYYLGVLLIFMSLYLISDSGENLNQPLVVSLQTFSRQGVAVMLLMSIMVIVLFGNKYQNRTYYYEIMNGTCTHKIIISKIVTYIFYVLLMFVVPNVIMCTIIGIMNGTGECGNFVPMVVIFCIITVRFVTEAVLATMIVRRMLPACIIMFLVSLIGIAVPLIAGEWLEASNDVLSKLLDCSVHVQILKLCQPEYSVSFIITVIVSFLMETAVLYGLAWGSYKRKNFR